MSAGKEFMNRFLNCVSFTKKEIRVIIFLVSVFIAGFIIKNFNFLLNGFNKGVYDYSASDNKFLKLSDETGKVRVYNASDSGNFDRSSARKFVFDLLSAEDSVRKTAESLKVSVTNIIDYEKINLNTASKDELTELPGVGESTAEKILIYRNEKNGFKKTEELLNIKGIGRKKYEKLKGFIKIE